MPFKYRTTYVTALLAALFASSATYAASFVIANGVTETTTKTLGASETGVIEKGGALATATTAITASGTDATITNSGSISTTNTGAYGIVATNLATNATITNSGSINTTESNAGGIWSQGTNATITNSGSINTTGSNAHGIWSASTSPSISITITNSGSINTTNTIAHGIYAPNTATITNSGLISVAGTGAFAIYGGGTTTQTLNIMNGSRIVGKIDLGAGTDTVNIYGGVASGALTFLNTENINIYIDNAVKVGSTVVVVDPTLESSRAVGLSMLSSGIHRVISQRSQRPTFVPVQVAALELTPGMLKQESAPMGWAQLFGSQISRGTDGQMLGYNHKYTGLLGGYEQDFLHSRLGFVAGAVQAGTSSSNISVDSDTTFAGIYLQSFLENVNITGSLMLGTSSHDNRRLVLDNVLGYQTAKSNNNSTFISPSITVSGAYELNTDWELRPSASVTYSLGRYAGYTESGTTNANLTVATRNANSLSSRLELEGAYKIEKGEIKLRVGLQSRNTNDDAVNANLSGSDFRFATAGKSTASGFFVGLGTQLKVKDNVNVVADIEYGQLSGDESQLSGQVTLQYLF